MLNLKRTAYGIAILFAVAELWVMVGAVSQQSSPGIGEHETKTAQRGDQQGKNIGHLLPATAAPVAPIVNVYTAKHAHDESQCAKPKDWKEWGLFSWCRSLEWMDSERVIAAWTVVLGIATSILGVATVKLWRSTDRLVEGAERTAERQLRAYVSVKEIKMEGYRFASVIGVGGTEILGQIHNYRISVVVENVGATPTRFGLGNINWELRDDELPDDFQFPDGGIVEFAAIGARGTFNTPDFFMTFSNIEKVIAKQKKLYVWGWIDYNDVFEDTPRHRTEYCFDIRPDVVPDGRNIYMRFPTHGRFNGTDGDCLRQPGPYKQPSPHA